MRTSAKLLSFLAVALLSGGCGRTGLDLSISDSYTEPDGAVISGDDTSLFVGKWICNDANTATAFKPFSTTDLLTFTENSDGTLTMVGVTLDGPGAPLDGGAQPCTTFTFYVWGPTAMVGRGQCTLDDGVTVTTESGFFAVSGNTATFNLVRGVAGGAPGTNSLTGACTRYVSDAGSN